MGEKNSTVLLAAMILGASIVAGSFLVKTSLDQAAGELAGIRTAMAEMPSRVAQAPARPNPRPQQANRPDPNRRYEISTEGSPARGPEAAKVTLVEFSDFECPFCGRVRPTLAQIEEEYGDDVRIVFKHLPLAMHPKAPAAHAASEAAHRQGKFWEMHDLIFDNQREISDEKYQEWAGTLGLDLEKFNADRNSKEVKDRVQIDVRQAQGLNVRGTPGFFVNGRFLSGAQPFEAFKRLIDEELKEG